MKRSFIALLVLSLVPLVSSCASAYEDPHPEWPETWLRIGTLLGAETPEGFTFDEGNDVLAAAGICYATWVAGEERVIHNEKGEEARAYDAQFYLLLMDCENADKAASTIEDWKNREATNYTIENTEKYENQSENYDILQLEPKKETNPYDAGFAAFTCRDHWAISVEYFYRDGFAGDNLRRMQGFLDGVHYGE